MERFLFAHDPLNAPRNGLGHIGYLIDTQYQVWLSVRVDEVPINIAIDPSVEKPTEPKHTLQLVYSSGEKGADARIAGEMQAWYDRWLKRQGQYGQEIELQLEPARTPD